MDFLWPGFLYLLIFIPALIAIYIWLLRHRRRFAVRYSSLALVRSAAPQHSWIRRHLPFALFIVALASLMVAVSRPVSVVSVPSGDATIVMAMDVSRSMCSTDILPSRLLAAEAAAQSFVQKQPFNTQIGIVAFSGFAEVIQMPTTDQELLQAAIESLTTGRRTAIGSAILKALDVIAEIDTSIAPSIPLGSSLPPPTPVAKGAYVPHIIVLLTDGVSNAGIPPLDAAQQAADRGVKVYTIGFGTADNDTIPNCSRQFQGNEPSFGGGGSPPFNGGGGGFGGFRRGIDEETLKQVAAITGGDYYSAESADELNKVFAELPTALIIKHDTIEVTVIFAALGALFAALAIALSWLWHPLP